MNSWTTRFTATVAGVFVPLTLLAAAPTAVAGPASAANEAAFLSWVHKYGAAMGVTGSDAQLLSDGYYSCKLRLLGQSPEANGISDLITTHAITYLCPAYNNSRS